MSSSEQPIGSLPLEVTRLRDWRHDTVDPELLAHQWRLNALDDARKEIEKRLGIVENELDVMSRSEEIAKAVAEQVNKERQLFLTMRQRVGAGTFAVCLVVLPVLLERLLP